jgi:hypothetical protein
MKKDTLENINSDLFNSFNPEEDLSMVGGAATGSVTGGTTFGPNGTDANVDGTIDFGIIEEEEAV